MKIKKKKIFKSKRKKKVISLCNKLNITNFEFLVKYNLLIEIKNQNYNKLD